MTNSGFTTMLHALGRGEDGADEAVLRTAYSDLRSMAARMLRPMPPGATLQPTALINEACLHYLWGPEPPRWENRGHFFTMMATAMHDVVVAYARRRAAKRRGGDRKRVPLDNLDAPDRTAQSVIDVDGMMARLAAHDAQAARIVQLHFFGGLTHEEIAAALDLSYAKVRREWDYAKAWLRREFGKEQGDIP